MKKGNSPPDGEKGTHVVTTQAPVPVAATRIDVLRQTLAGEPLKQITNYYAGNSKEAMRFMTAAVEYVRQSPKLLQCDRTSLVMALVKVAQFRFMPTGVFGEAYIIPYKAEAKFQLGYQGIVTLLHRTGQISNVTSGIVRENDFFEYEEGTNSRLIHRPELKKPRGDAYAVFTVVTMSDGRKTFKVMTESEVMEIKKLSKAKDSAESPWNGRDPEKWMWRKTCLIQHAKLLPKTDELREAIKYDFDGEGIDTPPIDPAGIATPRASHRIEEKQEPPEEEAPVHTEATELVCHGARKGGCGEDITKEEYDYSVSKFGKPLCRDCQKQV